MSLSRLEEFTRQAKLQVDCSKWLCEEIDKLVREEQFYVNNPYQDTPDLMSDRLARLEELQQRLEWEDTQQRQLLKKYSDIVD